SASVAARIRLITAPRRDTHRGPSPPHLAGRAIDAHASRRPCCVARSYVVIVYPEGRQIGKPAGAPRPTVPGETLINTGDDLWTMFCFSRVGSTTSQSSYSGDNAE